jgi:hypothetical protein
MTMKGTVDQVLGYGLSFVGYHEGPNNDTKFGREQGANHEPWCASFASSILRHFWNGKFAGSASAQALVDMFPRVGRPMKGALVGYHEPGGHAGINHVGMIRAVTGAHTFLALEGNTSDAVKLMPRSDAYVVKYSMPPYKAVAKPTPKPAAVWEAGDMVTPTSPNVALRHHENDGVAQHSFTAQAGAKLVVISVGRASSNVRDPQSHEGWVGNLSLRRV